MAQQNVNLKISGLYSFPNHLSSVPAGALLVASNIVINRDNIAECRRGFKLYGDAMGSTITNTAHQLLNYKGRILRHYGSGVGSLLDVDSNGTGTFSTFKVTYTGNTHSNTTIDNISTTSGLSVGMFISGAGIPANTTISSITNNTSIIISNAATATAVGVTLTFTYKISEVEQGLRIKGLEQNGNFYFTTSEGIKKISVSSVSDLSSAQISQAGGVKALDIFASINNTIGWFTAQSHVAYRVVWGIKDANQNFILGTPSERFVIRNTDTSTTKTTDLRITIPKSITTAHFYQIYRTAISSYVTTFDFVGDTTNLSTTITNIADTGSLAVGMSITGTGIPANTTITSISSTTSIQISNAATATAAGVNLTVSVELSDADPGDEQQLVYESNPTSTDLNNGYVSVNDITPDSFRGANLYTNADSGEGILQANDIPPLAKDITSFKNYTFYANTSTLQRLDLSLLSTSQLSSYFSGSITSNSVASPTVVTSTSHGLSTGRSIIISGSNSTPSIDGTYSVTVLTADTFSIPVNVTIAGSAGTWITTDHSTLTITDGTTSNIYTFTEKVKTGDTHSNDIIDNLVSTTGLSVGLSVSGTGLADNTIITEITSATAIKVSPNATATAAGVSLTFATESVTNKQIALSQKATPSQQVDETSRSLVRIINNQSTEIVNAFYLSGPNDLPGMILLEARNLQQTAFHVTVNDATTTGIEFNPSLPSSGNSVISDNEICPNRLYYSKYQQPEAVPILNYLDIGPKDKEILRILALRDNLFVLKEEGVYRLSGTAPFQVIPLDFSVNLKAPDSAVVLNNLIYVFTNQGIVSITDTGVNIISRPIEDKLLKLLTSSYTNFTTATFGISYETDRSYYLFTLTNSSDTVATQCFKFNTLTNSWTLLDLTKRCGIVNSSDDLLYLGATDTNYIEQERKVFDRTDFADREISLTLGTNAVSNATITLPSLTNITVGDVVVQTQYLTVGQFNRTLTKLDRDSSLSPHDYFSTLEVSAGDNLSSALDALITKIANDTRRTTIAGATSAATYLALSPTPTTFSGQQTTFNSLIALLNADDGITYSNYSTSNGTVDFEFPILSLDTTALTITTNYNYPIIEGPIVVYNHIATDLQFVPQFLGDVSMTKQVSEGTFIFEDSSFTKATISYSSDLSADFESIDVTGNGTGAFGSITFGNGVYGGNGSGVPFRTYIPREKQRCRYINPRMQHIYAREIFSLYGISLSFNPISNRGWR